MTFAEAVVFALAGYLVYRLLRPVRERLERNLRRWFARSSASNRVIDITDYSSPKKTRKKEDTSP